MQPVICITRKQFEKGRDVFTACSDFSCRSVPAEEERLAQKIIDKQAYAAIVGGSETYCDQLYKALPEGGVIARFGVGHEGIDKAKATQHGLLATNTPGTLEDSVAEHTVLLMGCAARKIAEVHRHIRNNHWEPVIGSELRDKNLLIVGCGRIGCRTARIA
ncbi:MAG: NAD(P)-dependent oxidoreductase, partial [Planctomycetota bacterium]